MSNLTDPGEAAIPVSTYRLQFNKQFTFTEATCLVLYLRHLGLFESKILLPVLGDHYGNILEQQELKLVFDAGQGDFSIYYYQHRFPVDPQTYPFILSSQLEQLMNDFAADDPVFLEYQTIDNSFSKLPLRTETTEEKIEERKRDKEVFKKHLARLRADSPHIIGFISFRAAEINRIAGNSGELYTLLEQQVYRLAYWRVANNEINYRRFFDINDLARLRIEYALSEVIACFPVYCTYINSQTVSKKDSQNINWAIEQGKQRSLAADKTVFEFIRAILLMEQNTVVPVRDLLKFIMKFQQYTAPVMAKGYEDTALYQYNRLISLNEVGGDPRHMGNSVNAFHHFNQERICKWLY